MYSDGTGFAVLFLEAEREAAALKRKASGDETEKAEQKRDGSLGAGYASLIVDFFGFSADLVRVFRRGA